MSTSGGGGAWKSPSVLARREGAPAQSDASWRSRNHEGSDSTTRRQSFGSGGFGSSTPGSSSSSPWRPSFDRGDLSPTTVGSGPGWRRSSNASTSSSAYTPTGSGYEKPTTFKPSYAWGSSGRNSRPSVGESYDQSNNWRRKGSGPESGAMSTTGSSWRDSGAKPNIKVCNYYRNGHCMHGNSCRFLHEESIEPEDDYPPSGIESEYRELVNSEGPSVEGYSAPDVIDTISHTGGDRDRDRIGLKVRELSRMIAGRAPLSASQAEHFLNRSTEVLDSPTSSAKEKFLQAIGTDDGLRRIVGFVEAQYDTDNAGIIDSMSFWHHCVPFLKLITHDTLRDSYLFEKQIGTMYNVIYGLSGTRAIPFFLSVVQHLSRTTSVSLESQEYGDAIVATTRALQMILKVNQSASVQEEFIEIAQSLRQCYSKCRASNPDVDYISRVVDSELRKVEQKLQIAEAIPAANQAAPQTETFTESDFLSEANIDFPGTLSLNGPRHDNDHSDIELIRILPTAKEIMSTSRSEYFPLKNFNPKAHFLPPGMERVVDTQFRLLREDTAGQVRDALRYMVRHRDTDPETLQSSRQTNVARMIIYTNVYLEELIPSERDGMQLVVTFDQPPRLMHMRPDAVERARWWEEARNLQVGALLCLVNQRDGFKCTFLTVAQRIVQNNKERTAPNQANQVNDLSGNPKRALITLKFVDFTEDIAILAEEYVWQIKESNNQYSLPCLIEFPGILFTSFEPILKYLQIIRADPHFPFMNLIAPEGNNSIDHQAADIERGSVIRIPPPAYLPPDFVLDLDVLKKAPSEQTRLTHSIERPCTVEELQAHTSLDKGQCEALISGLSREFALIQGPPGTGKSYVGLQLVKVLLHNRYWLKRDGHGRLGPIVCVCYTNHALDQFLMELLAHGVRKIVRIGSQSRSPELEKYSLRTIVRNDSESFFEERQQIRETKEDLAMDVRDLEDLCMDMKTVNNWHVLKNHLEDFYPEFHRQLFGRQFSKDGFKTVTHRKPEQAVNDWLHMKFLTNQRTERGPTTKTIKELVTCEDLSILSRPDRARLKGYWLDEIMQEILTQINRTMVSFQDRKKEIESVYHERERRCLEKAEIVGVTTTGLAMHAALLRKVPAKILICEEAGEVLEAHALTAILPSIQHAILIGDHKQLRPHIESFHLSLENPLGKKYALNESLFERLARERYGEYKNLRFPISTLDTQRRMHPSIANLIRQTIYPSLKDHQSVGEYPEVDGMARRVFWMDHEELEANADNSDPSSNMSKSNDFEVDMVCGLVKHLIRQGTYGKGEIAVLTPYLGQMMKLRKRLAAMYEIFVGDRDLEQIKVAENLEEHNSANLNLTPLTKKPVDQDAKVVNKGQLLQQLRLATVDNFQGEEARVIIISLVRCNRRRECGFLRTSNRINVLLSRARHGMYIIGSAETARPVLMWSQILTLLSRGGNFGDALQLRCPRHKDKSICVQKPDDFLRFAPEGGCDERCGKRLEQCGHACPQKCHSEALHQAVICQEECTRKLDGCDHACPVACGEKCQKCTVPIPQVFLPECGHSSFYVPCHKAQHPASIICTRSVMKAVPGCGHKVDVACFRDVASPSYKCPMKCGKILECGHTCTGTCHECQNNHILCKNPCGRLFTTCGHACAKPCHGGDDCGFCKQSCELSCRHSKCTKKCTDICTPCAEKCGSGCIHSGDCSMPCAIPCDILPCSKRCGKVLKCGHRCPSLCGEQCPLERYCQKCANETDLARMVDMISMETYKAVDLDTNPIIFLSCGHFFCMETVDGVMQMKDVYDFDLHGTLISPKLQREWIHTIKLSQLRCPECRRPILTGINRYNRITKGVMIETLTKRFTAKANQEFLTLEEQVSEVEKSLELKSEKETLRRGIYAAWNITRFTADRYENLKKLKRELMRHTESMTKEEEPYNRIRILVADCIRRRRISMTEHNSDDDNSVLLRNRLLLQILRLRLEWACLVDMHKLRNCLDDRESKAPRITLRNNIVWQLPGLQLECTKLEQDAAKAHQPRHQVEAKLFHARFIGLELALPSESASQHFISTTRTTERQSLDEALEICKQNPGCTRGLQTQIDEAHHMLRDTVFYSPVTTEEQRAVYEAMKMELRGTGHWYYCVNRHPFTIGECGMPMALAKCPQCDAPIGGQDHISVEGVQRAEDIENLFGRV